MMEEVLVGAIFAVVVGGPLLSALIVGLRAIARIRRERQRLADDLMELVSRGPLP